MIIRIVTSIFLLFFLSVGAQASGPKIPTTPIDSDIEFEATVTEIEQKIPEILLHREQAIEAYFEVLELIKKDKPLKRENSKKLYELSAKRKEIREYLSSIIEKYRYSIKKYKLSYYRKDGQDWAFRRAYLVTALIFMMDDNFLSEAILYQSNGKLRRFVNEANQTYELDKKDGLKKSAKIFYSFSTMADRARGIKVIKESKKWYPSKLSRSELMVRLERILNSSYAYNKRIHMSYGQRLLSNISMSFKKFFTGKYGIWDMLIKLKDNLLFGVAYGFGNSIAQIQWKIGRLYHDERAKEHLKQVFRPGDVIWDKTRHKVSGAIISMSAGFWNHNAFYVGTEEQLKELGVWDHEAVVPHHDRIREGNVIIEALGPGVVMNEMDTFMNIDDVAIAQRKEFTPEDRGEAVIRALEQYGKPYDFNMDTDSQESIICSELIYIVYDDIDWVQDTILGHWSVTPDQTALQTLDGGAFKLKTMYYLGKQVSGSLELKMSELLAI